MRFTELGSPTVSAIMPAYNAEHHLGDAIESILRQTFADWELIVVDDGSTDDTFRIASAYDDSRIMVVRLPANKGRGGARNEALRRANGKYIAICDADDISLPERFSREVDLLERRPDLDVVSGQVAMFWENEAPRVQGRYPQSDAVIRERLERGRMGIANNVAMIRAECFARFGGYCEELLRAEDLEFFMRIRRQCHFESLPDVLVHYRHEVGLPSLRKWIENSRYARYAAYRAKATQESGANGPVSFKDFDRQWTSKLAPYTVGLLQYAKHVIDARVRPGRTLR
jgi:glycosyltransferase involved in cell wall biosynthesis